MKLNPVHRALYNLFDLSIWKIGKWIIHIDRVDFKLPVQYGLMNGDPFLPIHVLTSEISEISEDDVSRECSMKEFWEYKYSQMDKIDKLGLYLDSDGWHNISIESDKNLQLTCEFLNK
jgi:hypothetical protein